MQGGLCHYFAFNIVCLCESIQRVFRRSVIYYR